MTKDKEDTGSTSQKGRKRLSEKDRLCAEHAEGMRDLFQQNPGRRQSWDPIRDSKRARNILPQLPMISDGGKYLSMDEINDTQDAMEEQAPNEAATNTSHNAIPRTRAPQESQQHKNGRKIPRAIEELMGTQEHEPCAALEGNTNDNNDQCRDQPQAHGDEVTSAQAVDQWSKDAERVFGWRHPNWTEETTGHARCQK